MTSLPDFGAQLRRLLLRFERSTGTSLKAPKLAAILRVSRSSVYAYLAGTTLPSAKILDDLLDAVQAVRDERVRLCTAREELEIALAQRRHDRTVDSIDGGRPIIIGAVPPECDLYQERTRLGLPPEGLKPDVASSFTILSGVGGVGKTQLAARTLRAILKRGEADVFVWVRADTRDGIVSAYTQAAAAVGIHADSPGVAAERLLGWLETTQRRWVVVLDDLVDLSHLQGLWPPAGNGRAILTTRRRDAALQKSDREFVSVPSFDLDEAVTYLAAKLDAEHQPADLTSLAEELGRLPLALAQASAFLADNSLSPTDYQTLLHDHSVRLERLFPQEDGLPDDHRVPVAAAWSVTIDQADRMHPAGTARAAMELASVLHPSGAPVGLWKASAALDLLRPAPTHDIEAIDAQQSLHVLHRLNLVTVDADACEVASHALIQRAVRDAMPPGRLHEVVRLGADALDQSWPERGDALVAQTLRANALTLLSHTDEQLWLPTPHPILYKIGNSLGDHGQIGESVTYFTDLTARLTGLYGARTLTAMEARHHVLTWTGKLGDPRVARDGLALLVTDLLEIVEPNHRVVIEVRADHAFFMGESGDYASAVAALTQTLDLARTSADPDQKVVLTIACNIAFFLGHRGEFARAADAYRAVLQEMTKVHGPDHLDTLKARSNAAGWTGRAGNNAAALAEYRDMLPDFERALGAEHIQTVRIRFHIARLDRHADPDNAEAEFRRVIAVMSDTLGVRHPHTIDARCEYALLLNDVGRATAAAAELRTAIVDAEAVFGPAHPKTAHIRARFEDLIDT